MAPAGTNPKIEELRFKVKADPKSRLFYPLAEELRKLGQFAEAEQVLKTGLTSHTAYLSAWVVLGRVLREQQKHAEAVGALTKALEIDRGNVVAARLLADSYEALGDKVEAIKKYKLVYALLPGDDEIESAIHRLEMELNPPRPAVVSLAEAEPEEPPPPPSMAAPPADGEAAPASDQADVFDITYSRLKRQASLDLQTGDAEPMSATHAESPFEELGTDSGYSADAYAVEKPAGSHLAAAPLGAESASPFPPEPLPPETSPVSSPEAEEEAAVYEPASEIAPGFIQGAFDANVPPPPPAAEDFTKTITMADLYANQGLIDEARDIYEDVLARDPGNTAVRARLDALEEMAAPPAAFSEQEEGTSSEEPAPAPEEPPAGDSRVSRLEDWLSKVKRV